MNLDYSQLETGVLDATATYTDRAWAWMPSRDAGALGLLTIACSRGKSSVEIGYEVEELPPLPGLMGREFKLTKQGGGEVYTLTLGAMERCSCMAGQTRGKEAEPCKHLAAMRAVEARGLLDHEALDNQRSGLAYHDAPGEPTTAELLHTQLEALNHGAR